MGGCLPNCAWGGALCTVCRGMILMILIGLAPEGCQLRCTSAVSDYPWWVGIVADQTHSPSGTSQLAEGVKGFYGPPVFLSVKGEASAWPGVLLALPSSMGKPAGHCCSPAQGLSPAWQFQPCPGLLGTSDEGGGWV